MHKYLLPLVVVALLAGCGLGETAVTAAAGGASEADQAREGIKTEQRVKQQVEAAQSLAGQQLKAAEAEAQ